MAKKLRIVNADGKTMSYQGKLLVFDLDQPQVAGMNEKERAETLLWLLGRSATNGPFRLEEF